MTYVVSNIHGDYEGFKKLLEAICFRDRDTMYILGDIVDYGEGSMELIEDISMRYNVFSVVGEHDYTALRMLKCFDKMMESGERPDPDLLSEMAQWSQDGGEETLKAYRELDADMKEGVIDYLSDMALYEEITVGCKDYLLVHAGIVDFEDDLDLDILAPEDFFTESLDLTAKHYENKTIIVGHEPTTEENGGNGKIFYGNGSIDIDCGNMRVGKLCCLCLDTGREYYI